VRLDAVASVVDSVQDLRNGGSLNGRPAVSVVLFKQPGANIIETVDRVRAVLPQLQASIPQSLELDVAMDRTPTIRASLKEVEHALVISIGLVIMVVFVFLRNVGATLIPSVAVPVSLCGTFGVMYLCGYTLDNLSLMALTVATGFVVDDAIVVLENIARHIEDGMPPHRAALQGAREVGFTVVAMTLSLIAVFIPLLLMGDIVGRMLREFAVVLSVAVLVSLVVSLTATPMMCARFLRGKEVRAEQLRANAAHRGAWYRGSERAFNALLRGYERSLAWALRHERWMLFSLIVTICLNVFLFAVVPKGFMPQQDTGRLTGGIFGDQGMSFQLQRTKQLDAIAKIRRDPAVTDVMEFTGSGGSRIFVTLKPRDERRESADEVIARLRKQLSGEPGFNVYLQAVQDVRMGGRGGGAQYQYTLQSDDLAELRRWTPRIRDALAKLPQLADVDSDMQEGGLQTSVIIDRDTAARLGVSARDVATVLNNAFGQRQVSVIYNPLNQYYVVMGLAPEYTQSAEALRSIYLINAGGEQIPLSAVSRIEPGRAPLSVNHQGQFAASTISFGLTPGVSLSQATALVERTLAGLGVPDTVQGSFQGTAKVYAKSAASQPWLIAIALLTLYIVLGMLYESYVHPLTILSTLPSAGVGALLALLLFRTELSLIALIGIFLLIGIVKKNAIMMIDFALVAERELGMSSRDAIFHACSKRFRPILMTTLAAALGALPLALGSGDGAELRRPLGISIVGGLLVSQLLTLYTTPVVYLYLDRFRLKWLARWQRRSGLATNLSSPAK
jgi:multidrug efflux pump